MIRRIGWIPQSTSVEEELLAEAEVRLYQAKLDAILGRRYDPDEYDQIVFTYRSAKRRADEARLVRSQAISAGSAKILRQVPPQFSGLSTGIAA